MFIRTTGKIVKLLSFVAIALMVFAGVSACAQSPNGNTPTQSQSPIKIGVSVPMTGDFSDDGKALQRGYQIWADEVNKSGGLLGRQVQLDMLNDNSDAKQVTVNYQKMITVDKDDLVVGPVSSTLTIAAMRVAKRYGYAFVEGVGTANSVFTAATSEKIDDLFAVSLPVKDYMTSFVNYILSLPQSIRPRTVAYISADDPFSLQPLAVTRTQFTSGGLQNVLDETYPAENTDFTSYAQKAVAANADVVVLGSTALADSVSFIKYFKQQKYDPKAFIALNGPDQGKAFTDGIGGTNYAEGIFLPNGSWTPDLNAYQNAQFVKDYLAKYGGSSQDISATSAEAYATVQVLQQAVNHIHSIDNASLIKELRSGSYNSVQGPVKFAADGENTLSVPFLFQWQNGQLIPVYPTNQAKANPEYPKMKTW